jgi:hypothetical protein
MPEYQQTKRASESKSNIQKQTTLPKQVPTSHPAAIIQRARINPKYLTHADVMQLQRTIGNRAVGRLLSEIGLIPSKVKQAPPVQMQTIPEEEKEPLQGKMVEIIQRQEIPEEEEPLQGKFESKPEQMACPSCFVVPIVQRQEIPEEEEPLQGKMEETIQRQEIPEEEESLQGKMVETIQRQEIPEEEEPFQAKMENNTGMPDNLKAGVESLSGIDMSDVRVHYNSSKPAEVGALAYTQGTSIHVAPGQERHLPHESWHVVQQAQGRVKPTVQMKGVAINDDVGLEKEAGDMGKMAKTAQLREIPEKEDRTEIPDGLKTGVENLSNLSIAQGAGDILQMVGPGRYQTNDKGHLRDELDHNRIIDTVPRGFDLDVGTNAPTAKFGIGMLKLNKKEHTLVVYKQNQGWIRDEILTFIPPQIFTFHMTSRSTETVPHECDIILTGEMGDCVTIIAMWGMENGRYKHVIGRHMFGGVYEDQAKDVMENAPPDASIYVLAASMNTFIQDPEGTDYKALEKALVWNRNPTFKCDLSNYKLNRQGQVMPI